MQIRRLSRLAGGTCEWLTVVSLNVVLRRTHFAKPQRSRYRRRHRNGEGSQIVTTSIFLYTRPVYQNYNLQKATNTNWGKWEHACGSEKVGLHGAALIKRWGVRWLALRALEKKIRINWHVKRGFVSISPAKENPSFLFNTSTPSSTSPLVQWTSWIQIRRSSRLAGGTCERLTVVSLNGVLRRMHFAKPQRSRYPRRHCNGEGSQI